MPTRALSLATVIGSDGALNLADVAGLHTVAGTGSYTDLINKPTIPSSALTFTGDVTGSGTTGSSTSLTLANSGVTAGSYGSATNIPAITVDSKGRITSVTNTAVSIPSGSLTFTGDVTGSGTTGSSTSLTLASVGTAGTYTKVTTDAKGRVTSGTTLASSDLPTYTGTLTSSQITTALGFTPENLANKAAANGYASLDSTGKVPTAQLSGFVDQTKPNIRPTLNLDFANSKIVDSRITFTRTTTASYYDLQGILKYAQPDEPRIDHDPSTGECRGLLIEEQRTNSFIYSAQFDNAAWTKVNATITANTIVAPDGTLTGDKFVEGSGASQVPQVYVNTSISASTVFTISIYAKAAERNWFIVNANDGFGSHRTWFNLSTGVVGTNAAGTTATITPVGNGWYRCTASRSTQSTVPNTPTQAFQVADADGSQIYTGNGFSGLFIWGAQLEINAAFATSYIPSTTTFTSRASSATYFDSTGVLRLAGTNQPRYGYGYDTTSGKWISQGLVLEAAATNLAVFSINPYATYLSTNTANFAQAPDGSYTAWKNVPNNGIALGNSTYVAGALTTPAAGTYCYSIYAKSSGFSRIRLYENGNGYNTYFNLTGDGSYDTMGAISAGIVPVGNGWYRCWIVGNNASGVSPYFQVYNGSTGDGVNGTLYWGTQIELGNVPSSFIYTYGATATRAADVSTSASTTRAVDSAVIKSSEFTKLNSSTAGTLYGEGTIISGTALVGGAPALVALSNSVDRDTHRFILRRTNMTGDATYAGFNYRLATVINGTSYSIDYSAAEGAQPEWEDSAVHKTIFAVDTTSQQAYGDGISAGITSISIPSFDKLDQVEIGQGGSSSSWNGHIRKVAYYNKRLSNTQLQALTQ